MERPDLLLCAHGSQFHPGGERLLNFLAKELRARGFFHQVWAVFLRQEPYLRQAPFLVEAEHVFVVPAFMSQGYFTEEVVPRELGLSGPLTQREGRWWHLCQPPGTHPRMGEAILHQVRIALGEANPPPQATALILVGHGTERNPRSAQAVHQHVAWLRQQGPFPRVYAAFLEQEPRLEEVGLWAQEPFLIFVPFLMAEGYHVETDILERARGLSGRRIWVAPAVGTHPFMVEVILERVRQAAQRDGDEFPSHPGPPTRYLDTRWGQEFLAEVLSHLQREGSFLWGQVLCQREGEGFELRHRADAQTPGKELQALSREALEDWLLYDEAGQYRPLRTAPNLRQGWRLWVPEEEELLAALETLYPGLMALAVHRGGQGLPPLFSPSEG